MVVDYKGRRAVIQQYETKGGKTEVEESIVILPERGYLVRKTDVKELTPPQKAGPNPMFQEAAQNFLMIDTSSVKYEQSVRYGDLVEGEQIQARPLATDVKPLTSIRLVFDREGRVLAVVR